MKTFSGNVTLILGDAFNIYPAISYHCFLYNEFIRMIVFVISGPMHSTLGTTICFHCSLPHCNPNMLQCGNEQWKHIVVPSVECIGPEITNTIMRMNSLYRKQWYDIAGYILKASPNINVTLPENVFICAYGYSYTYRIYITKAKAEELFPDAYDCRSYDDYNCTCIGMYKVCWECYTNQTYSTFLQNTIYKFTKNAYLPLVTHETCSNTFDSFARFTYAVSYT